MAKIVFYSAAISIFCYANYTNIMVAYRQQRYFLLIIIADNISQPMGWCLTGAGAVWRLAALKPCSKRAK